MNFLLFKKQIRCLSARLGILRPLKLLVIQLRGGNDQARKSLEWYSRFIAPGQLVFDVGANRGQSSEIFIKLDARVVAFEPQHDLHEEIRQLCKKNPNLIIEGCGLGDLEDTRRLYVTAYDQVASLREDWGGIRIGESEIQVSTLDKQIEKHGLPDYCKIDVEGWEPQVLTGLHQPISIISYEYHRSPSEISRAHEVLDLLSKIGTYHCNIKEETGFDFALPEFMPLKDFRSRFPDDLGISLKDGYGDIYCALEPSAISTGKRHD